MQQAKTIKIFFMIISGLLFFSFSRPAGARNEEYPGLNEVNIINDVSAAANTGGNYAAGGETVESPAVASVEIRTVINGQTVSEEKITGSSGPAAVVNIHLENTVKNDIASTTIIKSVAGESTKSIKPVSAGDATAQPVPEKTVAVGLTPEGSATAEGNAIVGNDIANKTDTPENIILAILAEIFGFLKTGVSKFIDLIT